MTFAPGQLPPVNAFWSITMYDGRTQLLIDNPINRYLVNSPMLPELKKNPDGSLTLFIQRDSPGKDKESNWLPAPDGPMFVVMRLYWPKDEAPSVYPLGQGAWKPPAIVPVRNLNALAVKRFGDKSLENIVRTDERYGHDGVFQGPRGWAYWNHLEYPKPIQNPNLWPDTQSTYFLGRLELPAGSVMTMDFRYPQARYFQFALYRWERNTFVAADAIAGPEIEPEPGSTNPFRVGANRLAERRDFKLRIVADDPPAAPAKRAPNTVYAGKGGGQIEGVIRIYLSDQGRDGAGWGPADASYGSRGFPTYSATLADGTKLSGRGCDQADGAADDRRHEAAADGRAVGRDRAREDQRSDARPGDRARAQGSQVGEVLDAALLGARCVQVARGARQDSVRGRDGRRRRSLDPVPRHLPVAQVRPGVRDARQDADLPEHLCRCGRQGPRSDARCADPVLVARQSPRPRRPGRSSTA